METALIPELQEFRTLDSLLNLKLDRSLTS